MQRAYVLEVNHLGYCNEECYVNIALIIVCYRTIAEYWANAKKFSDWIKQFIWLSNHRGMQ